MHSTSRILVGLLFCLVACSGGSDGGPNGDDPPSGPSVTDDETPGDSDPIDNDDGPPPVSNPDDRFADIVNGSDTNPGTADAPYQHLGYALAHTAAGATLTLRDGVYSDVSEGCANCGLSLAVPADLTIVAEHARAAELHGIDLASTNSSATVRDILFTRGGVRGNAGAVGSTITIEGCVFHDFARVLLNGEMAATMRPGSLAGSYIDAYANVIALNDNSRMNVEGGVFDGGNTGIPSGGGALIVLNHTSGLVLEAVYIQNITASAIAANITSAVSGSGIMAVDTHFSHAGGAGTPEYASAIVMASATKLTLDDALVEFAPGTAICVRSTANARIIVRNKSVIRNNGEDGVGGVFYAEDKNAVAAFSIDDSEFRENVSIYRGYAVGSWSISEGHFVDQVSFGFRFGDGIANEPFRVFVRDSDFIGNGSSAFSLNDNVIHDQLLVDFGNTSPGGNDFQGSVVELELKALSLFTTAKGNTWHRNEDGADANGHYAAGSVAGPKGTGTNFKLGSNNTIAF